MHSAHGITSHRPPKGNGFDLHQAAERFYHSFLLVTTRYNPKLTSETFFNRIANGRTPGSLPPNRGTRASPQCCFELLRGAYVEARYSPHDKITTDELEWLINRIEDLKTLVDQMCREHMADHPAISDGPTGN